MSETKFFEGMATIDRPRNDLSGLEYPVQLLRPCYGTPTFEPARQPMTTFVVAQFNNKSNICNYAFI